MTDLILADVSEFQGSIDWASYGASTPAAIVRVHNGYRSDNYAAANIAGARAHCAWRGWYQYLPANVDPAAAAQAFAARLGPPQPGEVLILDLEEGSGDQTGRAAAWHAALRAIDAGNTEWTYSGAYFARAHLGGSVEWIASYGTPEPSAPHTLWQFTDARAFPGIAGTCDGSIFHGSVADLLALTGAGSTQQEVPDMTPDPIALLERAVAASELASTKCDSILNGVVYVMKTELPQLGGTVTAVLTAMQHQAAGQPLDAAAISAAVEKATSDVVARINVALQAMQAPAVTA